MSTFIYVPASSLSSGGCTSMSTSGDYDSFNSVGSLLTSTATGVSSNSSGGLRIEVGAVEVAQSKAYVQSLSIEEQHELLSLLDEKEQQLEEVKPYIKKLNNNQ